MNNIGVSENKSIMPLSLITICNVILLLVRNYCVGNENHNFLLCNLFLGVVPFLIVLIMKACADRLNSLCLFMGWLFWLLFYPNSPYMITDLIHIKKINEFLLYDSVVYFSLAILSAFWGFYSISLLYSIILKRSSSKLLATSIIIVSIILSSFGIYLGRVLRLNSWDVFVRPFSTFTTILTQLLQMLENPTIYMMVLLFSFLQATFLYLIKEMKHAK